MQSAELFVLSQQMSGTLKLQPCIHFSTSLLLIVNGTLSSEHCLYILLQSTESPMDVRNSIAPRTRCELAVERKQRIFHCMCHVQCSLWTRLYTTGLNLIIDTTGSNVKQTCWLHNWYFQWSTFYSMQCNLFGAILFLFFFVFFIFAFLHFCFFRFIFSFFPFSLFFGWFSYFRPFKGAYRNMWLKLKHFDGYFLYLDGFFSQNLIRLLKNDEFNMDARNFIIWFSTDKYLQIAITMAPSQFFWAHICQSIGNILHSYGETISMRSIANH